MTLNTKYDFNAAFKKIVEEQCKSLGITYVLEGFGEIVIKEDISRDTLEQLSIGLNAYGIEIVEDKKNVLVQKIKDTIVEMIFLEDKLPTSKISVYLSSKLNQSYGHLANIFSDVTYTSIENFIILQKIERAKQLISTNDLSFTEITWKLNYSSVAHFSTQFKNVTGLTPTAFQRILNKKRQLA